MNLQKEIRRISEVSGKLGRDFTESLTKEELKKAGGRIGFSAFEKDGRIIIEAGNGLSPEKITVSIWKKGKTIIRLKEKFNSEPDFNRYLELALIKLKYKLINKMEVK